MHVLVVDDDPVTLDIIEIYLLSLGYAQVTFACSGEEALRLAAAMRPAFDMVVVDTVMPGLSGAETVERLRVITDYAEVPVVMLGAVEDRALVQEALSAGGTVHVVKPLERVALGAGLSRALEPNWFAQDLPRAMSVMGMRG